MVTGVFFLPYCLCIDIPFSETRPVICAFYARAEVMMAPGRRRMTPLAKEPIKTPTALHAASQQLLPPFPEAA
jgi:hypothetical protein